MKMQFTQEDLDSFVKKFRDWSKGLDEKERVLSEFMIGMAQRRANAKDDELSENELEHVAGGRAKATIGTYVRSGYPMWCCG
jgi:hypothetical protein